MVRSIKHELETLWRVLRCSPISVSKGHNALRVTYDITAPPYYIIIQQPPNFFSFFYIKFNIDPFFMILEYASKGPLQTFLRRNRPGTPGAKPPPAEIFLRFAIHTAKGMTFLQTQKVR